MNAFRLFILSFFLILFFAFPSNAQPKVDWGSTYEKQGSLYSSFYLAGGDANNYYVVMDGNLLGFDFSHKLKSTTSLDLQINNQKVYFRDVITTKSKTFGVFSDFDKKKNAVFIQTAELENGKVKPVREAIMQPLDIQYKLVQGFGTINYGAKSKIVISSDKSRVATIRTLSNKTPEYVDKISIIVFDENMNVKWQKIQNFPIKDSKLLIQDFIVSNNGEVFIAVSLDLPKGSSPNFTCKILKCTENDFIDYKINLSDNYIVSRDNFLLSSQANTNEVLISGFCRKGDSGEENGVFFSKLDVSSGIISSKAHGFSDEFLQELLKNRNFSSGKEIFNFKVSDFVSFPDGSFSFIAERNYNTVSSSSNLTYSEGLIIPRFESNGEIRNMTKVDKSYGHILIDLTSYTVAIKNNKLFLLYNDFVNRQEGNISGGGFLGAKKNSFTTLSIIDEKGNLEVQKTLFSGLETNGLFYRSNSAQVGGNILINILNPKDFHFGTLKLE